MAVTKGQGNPHWNREETILALDLYFDLQGPPNSKANDRVSELSNFLRSLPYHADARINETFRNLDGVRFKIQNLRNALTGEGLSNHSAMDKRVAEEFGDKRTEVKRLADQIRSAATSLAEEDYAVSDDFEGEFYEGKSVFAAHRRRERNPRLRKKLLENIGSGGLSCAICNMSRPSLPNDIQESLFEVHHLIPLSEFDESKPTRLDDVTLLCASCHRGIHKLISDRKQAVTILEAIEALT